MASFLFSAKKNPDSVGSVEYGHFGRVNLSLLTQVSIFRSVVGRVVVHIFSREVCMPAYQVVGNGISEPSAVSREIELPSVFSTGKKRIFNWFISI